MRFKVGDIVIRSIEGLEFEARVLEINQRSWEVKLEYTDDGNIESGVSFEEIQEIFESKDDRIGTPKHIKVSETLAKPLLGLVDDDCETRKNHQPKVFIHANIEEEEGKSAIILNGAENRLAAGGGLRGIRYLKK